MDAASLALNQLKSFTKLIFVRIKNLNDDETVEQMLLKHP